MSEPSMSDIDALLARFRDSRGWGKWHTPTNLALALAGEVGELCQLLRWGHEDVDERRVASELADIAIFLLHLCQVYNVDLLTEVQQKVRENERRFPVGGSDG